MSYKHYNIYNNSNRTLKRAFFQPLLAATLSIAAVPQCFGLDTSNDYMSYSLHELLNVKLTTASKLPEALRETPGAISVITRDEISRSGARTLLDLLVSRVPGFNTLQDNNEHLAAVRGIYATTNQKVLLLRDGQRLNEFRPHSYFRPQYL